MTFLRADRVKEVLRKEISQIIREDIKDPRVGFATVTDVELSQDLRHAKVFVSVYGEEEERKNTLKALEKASGFIRSEVGKRVRMKHIPEILFRFDESIERGARIFELLNEIEDKEK